MNDTLLQAILASSYLLNLAVMAGLWWTAARVPQTRRFWGLLGAAWTLNVLGNGAWIGYDILVGSSLPTLSWIDAIYLGRYLLVGLALGAYPTLWSRRRGVEFIAILVAATLLAWFMLYRPTLAVTERSWTHFIGVAIYPIFDAGLLYAAWRRGRETASRAMRQALALFTLALLSYGIANWINFRVRMVSLEAYSLWADLCWLLSDVLTALALVRFYRLRSSTPIAPSIS
jgi:hypothetical protein